MEHVGLFFVAKKAGAQRFIIDMRAGKWHLLNPLLDRCSQGRVFAMLNFRGRLKTLETGSLVPPMSRTRFTGCAFLDCCKRILNILQT